MSRELTVSQLYKYKHLKPYIGLQGRIPIKHKDVFVGVEIELENVTGYYEIGTRHYTEDHSLKVDGAEFVTIPIKMKYLEVELQRLFSGFKGTTPSISSRCSTHVHVNVRDMTPKEVLNMVMLYMIFERSLYRVSGDRWHNNFCIPLCMATQTVRGFFNAWDKAIYWGWYKYMGLNISPIWGGESSMIGTVEFRQLHGTTNVEEIIQWCNMITSLKRAAQTIDQEELLAHIRTMNTTSGYSWLVKEVFGRYSKLLTDQSTFVLDVEKCISVLKACIPDEKLGYIVKKASSKVSDNHQKVTVSSLFDQPVAPFSPPTPMFEVFI